MPEINGTPENNSIFGTDESDTINGGAGNDTIRGLGGADQLNGDEDNDYLIGGADDDLLNGGEGIDRAGYYHTNAALGGVTVDLTEAGAQDVGGGQGFDTFVSVEYLSGTPFADDLTGNDGDNWLWGAAATIFGGGVSASNDDRLDGGGGNDLLTVGIGDHMLIGGTGIDTVSFTENGSPESGITVTLTQQGVAQTTGNGSWNLTGIENLVGGVGNDVLTGDANPNALFGHLGNDTLNGNGGADTLYGDGAMAVFYLGASGPITTHGDVSPFFVGAVGGNDTMDGGEGDDVLFGAGGSDTASYASATGGVQAFLYNSGFGESLGAGYDQLFSIENLTGSAFDDFLAGNNQANALSGSGGNDMLVGGVGNDTLDGGEGIDRVGYYHTFAGIGGVTVNLSTAGPQAVAGAQGSDTLIGIEHVSGTPFADTLTGNSGNNWLWGAAATMNGGAVSATNNDTLDGAEGDDLLTVGMGTHNLIGGSGIDTVSFTENGGAETAITLSLDQPGVAQATGNGSWTLTGIENLVGGLGNDHLTGDGGANALFGHLGDDTLAGAGGNDTLYGDGALAVFYSGSSGPITTHTDVSDFFVGGVGGNDMLDGGLGDDTLHGGGGSDTARYATASGAVVVDLFSGGASGAAGNDILISIENAIGSEFNDILWGSGSANLLTGLGGNDRLTGDAGNDMLDGGAGIDFLIGGADNDLIHGGAGNDRAGYYHTNEALGGVTVSLANLAAQSVGGGQGVDTISGVEHVSGTPFADMLTGDDGNNWLWGAAATIAAGNVSATNNDRLDGAGGDDLLTVGIGNHTLIGGIGTDTLRFSENGGVESALRISLGSTRAQATGAGTWTVTDIENISGGTADDQLSGNDLNNVLAGDRGNDTLTGGGGNDVLIGDGFINTDAGLDITTVYDGGIGGNDTLVGGRGVDFLYGGRGDDRLTGGADSDWFVFYTASGDDSITDFGRTDRIAFDTIAGIDDFGDLTIISFRGGTMISWGSSDSIFLEGVRPSALSAANFHFGAPPPVPAAAIATASLTVIEEAGYSRLDAGIDQRADYLFVS